MVGSPDSRALASWESFGFLASDHARPRVSPPLSGSLGRTRTSIFASCSSRSIQHAGERSTGLGGKAQMGASGHILAQRPRGPSPRRVRNHRSRSRCWACPGETTTSCARKSCSNRRNHPPQPLTHSTSLLPRQRVSPGLREPRADRGCRSDRTGMRPTPHRSTCVTSASTPPPPLPQS